MTSFSFANIGWVCIKAIIYTVYQSRHSNLCWKSKLCTTLPANPDETVQFGVRSGICSEYLSSNQDGRSRWQLFWRKWTGRTAAASDQAASWAVDGIVLKQKEIDEYIDAIKGEVSMQRLVSIKSHWSSYEVLSGHSFWVVTTDRAQPHAVEI